MMHDDREVSGSLRSRRTRTKLLEVLALAKEEHANSEDDVIALLAGA